MRSSILLLFLACGGILSAAGTLDKIGQDSASSKACFADPNADSVLRRAAFRRLLEDPAQADQALDAALKDSDPQIRQYAVYNAFLRDKEGSYAALKTAALDSDAGVARVVLTCAIHFPDRKKSVELLTLLSEKSPVAEVKRSATRIVDFPFYRENRRLKDDPTYDHEVQIVKSIPLPKEGLKFRQDPAAIGHKPGKEYFKPNLNEKRWKNHKIGVWESQGLPGYDGIAWYRIHFTAPEKMDCNAVELHFGAVDEVAWVWLNGIYVGQHDIGTLGWDKPFDLDVTKEIRWGKENVLVVRVEDTRAAGGIWKPITLNVLK